MTSDLAASMRAAARLTREGKFGAATRLIQTTLGGGALSPDHAPPEPAPSGSAALRPAAGPASRATRPLADILRTVRKAKRTGLTPDAPQPARKSPPIPDGARFLTLTHACPAGRRDYKLYVPRGYSARRRWPLLVMLHGCKQHPDDFALGTRMNALAEKHRLLIAYPWQPKTANPSLCWNWFNPRDQRRGAGEPAIIAGIVREIGESYRVDPERVFVAGLSAGGAMAAVMGETYPELFSAVGIHSGLATGTAHDVVSAFAAMRGEELRMQTRRPASLGAAAPDGPRTIVFHGDADTVVHPSNSGKILGTDKRGDTVTETRATDGGRPYLRRVLRDGAGAIRAESWTIAGAGHAWSGGSPEGSFADPKGPDASREMIRFFLETGPRP